MKSLSLLIILTIASCASPKQFPKTLETNRTEKDSISRFTTVKDTVIIVQKADTARIAQLVNNLTETPIRARSNQATVTLRKVGNQIQADCVCDELKEAVKIYQETIERYKTITQTQEATIIELKKELPGWAKPFLYLGIAVVIGIFALATLFLIKLFK